MQTIHFKRLIPSGEVQELHEDLLTFLLREARLTYEPYVQGTLPSLETLNDILQRGTGDDGLIIMTWTPFSISDLEYKELEEAFRSRQANK